MSTIIEELNKVPGAEPIAQLIQTIMELDDATLNDTTIEMIKNSVKDSIEGENRIMTVRSIQNAYRQNGVTIAQAQQEYENMNNSLNEIETRLQDELSTAKKDLVRYVFQEMLDVAKDATDTYFIEDVQIFVQKVNENAKIPTYADSAASGADIYATEDFTIPKSTRGMIIKTGLKMAIPLGWELQVRPRSGLSYKTAMRVSNTPGTIDAGYPDEIGVIVDNLSSKDITIAAGDRIAQFVLAPVYRAKFTEVDSVNEFNAWSPRNGGFGSTGK